MNKQRKTAVMIDVAIPSEGNNRKRNMKSVRNTTAKRRIRKDMEGKDNSGPCGLITLYKCTHRGRPHAPQVSMTLVLSSDASETKSSC